MSDRKELSSLSREFLKIWNNNNINIMYTQWNFFYFFSTFCRLLAFASVLMNDWKLFIHPSLISLLVPCLEKKLWLFIAQCSVDINIFSSSPSPHLIALLYWLSSLFTSHLFLVPKKERNHFLYVVYLYTRSLTHTYIHVCIET